jgi:hypothetical protein
MFSSILWSLAGPDTRCRLTYHASPPIGYAIVVAAVLLNLNSIASLNGAATLDVR